MIFSYSDIIKIEKNERRARDAIASLKYIKIAPGLYSDEAGKETFLSMVVKRYKNVTVTMQTAFEYYDLTDFNYDKYTIAFPHGSRKVSDDRMKQFFIEKDIYDIGRIKIEKNGTCFYIYDKERMLIELIRNKKKLPYDYYKEVVNSYRSLLRDGKIDTRLLLKYAKGFKNGNNIIDKIMEVIS